MGTGVSLGGTATGGRKRSHFRPVLMSRDRSSILGLFNGKDVEENNFGIFEVIISVLFDKTLSSPVALYNI
jgi:hypothetical protein